MTTEEKINAAAEHLDARRAECGLYRVEPGTDEILFLTEGEMAEIGDAWADGSGAHLRAVTDDVIADVPLERAFVDDPGEITSLFGLAEHLADMHICGLTTQDVWGIDADALPTFGGDPPDDTTGVWSWDRRHLLVGDSFGDLRIERR